MSHSTRYLVAGIVALLPIGGTVVTVAWLESTIRAAFFSGSTFYFPGLGLLLVLGAVYGIGFAVTSIGGRWLFGLVDRLLDHVPLLGMFHRSLKQILGYGKGADALFQRVVLVESHDTDGQQIGLLTRAIPRSGPGCDQALVFVPGSPNPTIGRLLLVDVDRLQPTGMEVHEALELLVTLGKATHAIGAKTA